MTDQTSKVEKKKSGKPKRKPSPWNEFFSKNYATAEGTSSKEKMKYLAGKWKEQKEGGKKPSPVKSKAVPAPPSNSKPSKLKVKKVMDEEEED